MTDSRTAKTPNSALAKPDVSLRHRMLFILLLTAAPGIVVAVFLTVQRFSEETRQIEMSAPGLPRLVKPSMRAC